MAVLAPEVGSAAPRWLIRHETLLAAILVVALAILGLFNERFLTIDNLLNQGRLMTEVGLLALPMTFIIITGGIDLSVGSIVGLCAIMLGYSWKNLGFSFPPGVAVRVRDRGRRRRRLCQRVADHPRPGAAADHDHRHFGALSGTCRRHQSGAVGAQLSRMVLLHRARGMARSAGATLDPAGGDHRGRNSIGPHHLRPHAL